MDCGRKCPRERGNFEAQSQVANENDFSVLKRGVANSLNDFLDRVLFIVTGTTTETFIL